MRAVRWLMTMWCNYRCWYCRQDHRRNNTFGPSDAVWSDVDNGARPTGRAHWADNRVPLEWLEAFRQHFSQHRTTFTLTGGEPMLDLKNMSVLLPGLVEDSYVQSVRIDTNGSWDPAKYPNLDKSKIGLMVSYHPTEVGEAEFLSRLAALRDNGWRVGVVNLVAEPSAVSDLARLERAVRPAVLSPLLAYASRQYYTEEQLEVLRLSMPAEDWYFKSGGSTLGSLCMYPALAYEVNPDGSVEAACSPRIGSLFDAALPELPVGPVSCPLKKCTCTDRYSHNERITVGRTKASLDAYIERMLTC